MFKIKMKIKCAELLNMIAISAANRSKKIIEEVQEEIRKWKS